MVPANVSADVLLVEDERAIREPLAEALRDEGYRVVETEDGEIALACLAREPFDVVVTDIRMPRVDGLEVLRQMRERWPETPALVITAYGPASSVVAALGAEAVECLMKPFHLDDILARVARLVARRRRNESPPSP